MMFNFEGIAYYVGKPPLIEKRENLQIRYQRDAFAHSKATDHRMMNGSELCAWTTIPAAKLRPSSNV